MHGKMEKFVVVNYEFSSSRLIHKTVQEVSLLCLLTPYTPALNITSDIKYCAVVSTDSYLSWINHYISLNAIFLRNNFSCCKKMSGIELPPSARHPCITSTPLFCQHRATTRKPILFGLILFSGSCKVLSLACN